MSDDFMNFNPNQPTQQQGLNNPMYYYSEIISKMVKDMKFVAYYTMTVSVLACLTIIGAIFGIPFFIAGMRLRDASDRFIDHIRTNDIQTIYHGFEKLRTYFFIQKVYLIIGIIFMIIYIVFFIILFSSGSLHKLVN